MCLSYKKKHDVLISAINEYFSNDVIVHGNNAGLHIVLQFSSAYSDSDLVRLANRRGIYVSSISKFWIGCDLPKDVFILLGYGLIPEESIRPAIRLLRNIWFP